MTITLEPDGTIAASKYGVVPGPDCTTAFLALVAARAADPSLWASTIQLPPGGLNISQTIDGKTSSKCPGLFIRGDGQEQTSLYGNVPGPLLAWNAAGLDQSGSLRVSGMSVSNGHPSGTCIQGERIERSLFKDLVLKGNRGLIIGDKQATNVEIVVKRCLFNGDIKQWPFGVGAALNMHGSIKDCAATLWRVAIKLARFVTVEHLRLEGNGVGLLTGQTASGLSVPYGGSITDVSLEANEVPLLITKNSQFVRLVGCRILGTGNPTTHVSPAVGVNVQAGSGPITFDTVTVSGSFSTAAVQLSGDGPVVLTNSNAANKSGGANWAGSTPAAKVTAIQSNYP